MIEVRNLCAGYSNAPKKRAPLYDDDVIHNISFSVKNGECLCIVGPNGSGKSTLLKALARVIDCRGDAFLDGKNIAAFSRKALARSIALLEQSPKVFFPYTVYETVFMGRYAHSEGGFFKTFSAADREIVERIIIKMDIADLRDRLIDELSGGQLQRVFLAKTLAQTPEAIFLDEPTNHLDLKYQLELLAFLKTWVRENNKILISVFHDLNLARFYSDTMLVLAGGTVAACSPVDEVLDSGVLQAVYGMDIHAFMKESLSKWLKGDDKAYTPDRM
jgi:iron complex transport system ATP-binding protein